MISAAMRVGLLLGGIGNAVYVLKKIQKSKIANEEAVFWVWSSFIIVLFAVFPGLPIFFARLLGIESSANLIFLFFIALLLVRVFQLSLKLSALERKIVKMNQKTAIKEKEKAEL